MTARRSLLSLGLVALGVIPWGGGCGGPEQPPPEAKAADEGEPIPIVVPPVAASTGDASSGGTIADPFDTEGWDEGGETDGDATAGGETDGAANGPTPVYAGPCTVRWNGGPILRFKHDADGGGGLLRIDGDNDGRVDVCARFWNKDGRAHKITVDEACDKSTEATITPSYDPAANVATASYTDHRDGKDAKHEITLLTLPAFTGIAPGYPLYAPRADVELVVKDGRVTKASVAKPIEGPPVKVALKYDGQGRVTRIDEDHQADGKIDRRFDYRYDEVGNVTGMTLTETDFSDGGKGKKTKKTAKLAYGCWASATPRPAEPPSEPPPETPL
jgi:RHS Repeat